MSDRFPSRDNVIAPASRSIDITPNDGVTLPEPTRGLYVGGGGALRVLMADDTTERTFLGVQAGSWLPFRVARVFATGTTATGIVGLY